MDVPGLNSCTAESNCERCEKAERQTRLSITSLAFPASQGGLVIRDD